MAKSPFCQTGDELFIEVIGKPKIQKNGSELGDTITINFNLLKNRNTRNQVRYSYLNEKDEVKITVSESIGDDKKVIPPTYIEGSLKKLKKGVPGEEGSIPSDITISLLVDRSGSIDEQEMAKIKEAVRAFVNNVPEGCLYYSWFHDDISSSILLTKDNFEEANFDKGKNTALYNAIYAKLLEFDKTSIIPNVKYEPMERNADIAKRESLNNYLIVLTDGVNDVADISKYKEDDMEEIMPPKLFNALEKYKNKIKVYALGFGENSDHFDEEELKRICMASGNPNGYFLAKPDSILQLLKIRLTDEMTPDYEIKLLNQKGKTYQGNLRNLTLEINAPDAKIEKAIGSVNYALGSTVHQLIVGRESIGGTILRGLIAGLVFLLVVMIIIQLIIPLIKNKIFDVKYVKKYKPAPNEIRKECQFCGDPINAGESIIMKCQHIVHKVCWGDFGYVCPEYGQNCNDGKQNYFDINDPFSKKNKIYYLKWVFFGLIGGFLTWIFYLLMKDMNFIQSLSSGILNLISPNITDESIIELFTGKIASLLLIGILMGLFLTFFFAYVED
ncbi:MAG: VWA domain-containing protein, partial [Bacteroidales bacterium]